MFTFTGQNKSYGYAKLQLEREHLEAKWYRIRLPVQEMWVQSLGQEGPLEEEMATHSSILSWRIPWTEEPGSLQSMGLQIGGHWEGLGAGGEGDDRG